MANVQHSSLTGSSLHENKGVSSATDNTVATAVSGATVWAKLTASNLTGTGNSFGGQLLHVQDEKTSGTDGGTFSSGAWVTRTLNTVKTNEISSASLAANVISLPAGTYYVQARAPGHAVVQHQIRLRNTSDSADLVLGSNAEARANVGGGISANATSDSVLNGRFTLSGTKNVELQHRCFSSFSTNGLGTSTGWGTEIYAQVYIWKVG